MRSRYYALTLCLLCCLLSCSRNRETESRLDSAESLMTEHPDKALSVLKTIDASRLHSESTQARYALLYTQALDKNYVDVASDSLICSAVTYYDRNGSKQERALAHYYYGCVCANMHEDSKAIESFVLAENYAGQVADAYLQGLINSRIGILYSNTQSYTEAMLRFQQAEIFFREAQSMRNTAMSLESQSYIEYLLGNYDSAKDKKSAAREIYTEIGDKDAAHNIDLQLIPIRIEGGEDSDAVKKSLRKICTDYYEEPLSPHTAGIWLDLYMRSAQLDSARLCGRIILENCPLYTEHQIAGCYALLVEIEKSAGNFEKALEYGYRYTHLSDSLNTVSNQAQIEKIEHRYNNELLRESLANFRLRQRLQRIIFTLVFISVIIAGCIVGVIVVRWRKNTNDKIRKTEAELDNLKSVYNDLTNQYADMKQHLDIRNERELKVGKAIEERLSGLHHLIENVSTTKPAAFIKEFKKYTSVNTNSKYALFDLQYIVNQKYCGIIDYLKAQYPELNKHDLDLCALMCFGFSHAGICYLYDYSDLGSFYNKRSRLRRKLHLPQDYKIEDFIQISISELRKS